MLSQISQSITFGFFFTKSKVGVVPSSAPTVNVERKGSGSLLVTGGTSVQGVNAGVYYYTLTGGSDANPDMYIAVAHTSDTTVDQQDVPAAWIVGNSFAQAVPSVSPANPSHPLITSGTGANEINPDGSGNVSANLTPAAVTAAQNGLATSANQTTILNRLGSFAGTTASSIFAALRKLGGI